MPLAVKATSAAETAAAVDLIAKEFLPLPVHDRLNELQVLYPRYFSVHSASSFLFMRFHLHGIGFSRSGKPP